MLFTRWRASDRPKDKKMECKTPKKSPREEKYHGCSTSSVVLAKEQVNIKVSPFFIKGIGRKIMVGTYLWLKNKSLIYIHYKTGLDNLVKWWSSIKMTEVNVTLSKQIIILTKWGTDRMYAVIMTDYPKYPPTTILKHANVLAKVNK